MARTTARRSPLAEADPARAIPNALTTLPLAGLRIGALNPRKHFDETALVELGESILQDGILQNLVVRRLAHEPGAWEIVCGARRYRAAISLVERGRLRPDAPIPVRIVELDDLAALRMATVENVQRQDMTPLEEADAFAAMVALGDSPDTVAALTGLNLKTVQQRLALHYRLAPGVRQALDEGRINLGQAQAFTVAETDRQEKLLAPVLRDQGLIEGAYHARDIRDALTENRVPMSRAIFDPALYQGPRVGDLFGPEAEYATDRDAFRALQLAAAEARKDALAETWAWAELRVGGHFEHWRYDSDRSPAEGGGVVLHMRDDLAVVEHTGLVSRKNGALAARAGDGAAGDEDGQTETRFSKAHLAWARQEKSRRLQCAIAQSPRVALSLAILGLLHDDEVHIRSGSLWAPAPQDRIGNDVIEETIEHRLGPVVPAAERSRGMRSVRSGVKAFRALVESPHIALELLLAALIAEQFATWPGRTPALGDTPLAIAVADALGLEPRPFVPTAQYLQRLSRAELVRVARETGIAEDLTTMKKSEMIDAIALAPDRDPSWSPAELRFGLEAELEQMLQGGKA